MKTCETCKRNIEPEAVYWTDSLWEKGTQCKDCHCAAELQHHADLCMAREDPMQDVPHVTVGMLMVQLASFPRDLPVTIEMDCVECGDDIRGECYAIRREIGLEYDCVVLEAEGGGDD